MTNASVAQSIEQFVLSITSHVLSEGQGHNSQKTGDVELDLAWHLQDDRTWCLYLAVDNTAKKTSRTKDTKFETSEDTKEQQAKALSKLLLEEYKALTA